MTPVRILASCISLLAVAAASAQQGRPPVPKPSVKMEAQGNLSAEDRALLDEVDGHDDAFPFADNRSLVPNRVLDPASFDHACPSMPIRGATPEEGLLEADPVVGRPLRPGARHGGPDVSTYPPVPHLPGP